MLESTRASHESRLAELNSANASLIHTNTCLEAAHANIQSVAKEYHETLVVRDRELAEQRMAKEKLKERCVRLRQKYDNLKMKVELRKKPLKWHQRFIRRVKGLWRAA